MTDQLKTLVSGGVTTHKNYRNVNKEIICLSYGGTFSYCWSVVNFESKIHFAVGVEK